MPLAAGFLSVLRPLLGLGLFATVLLLFRPLLSGIFRAGWMLLRPPVTRARRYARRRAAGRRLLQDAARRFEKAEPEQANELRRLASRG
jgi:hypothetical protein